MCISVRWTISLSERRCDVIAFTGIIFYRNILPLYQNSIHLKVHSHATKPDQGWTMQRKVSLTSTPLWSRISICSNLSHNKSVWIRCFQKWEMWTPLCMGKHGDHCGPVLPLSSRSQWKSYLSQVLYRNVDVILVDAVMKTSYYIENYFLFAFHVEKELYFMA